MSDVPRLLVEPANALVDHPRHIHLSAFTPGAKLVLRGSLDHPDGSHWENAATFVVDADGQVDLARAVPLQGDWQHPDPSAPLWSLRRLTSPQLPTLSEGLAPLMVTLHAE